jgi:hypothetical protein
MTVKSMTRCFAVSIPVSQVWHEAMGVGHNLEARCKGLGV